MTYNLEAEYGSFLDLLEKYISEKPSGELAHYGVLGMKWGVRKDKKSAIELTGLGPDTLTKKTKNGEVITLSKTPPPAITKFLAKLSKKFADTYNSGAYFTIKDSAGKTVGNASIDKRSDDELYLNWIGVNSDSRGKGYASATMQAAAEFGRQEGFKKMTLEVPGNAPDALHIYESMGFTVTEVGEDDGGIWGGLTSMEYVFEDARAVSHADALAHYGVLGMKWGVRKPEPSRAAMTKARRNNKDRREKALATGGTIGAAVGAVGSQLALGGAIELLKSPEFNRWMADRAISRLEPHQRILANLVTSNIINFNRAQALLLSQPEVRAGVGVGAAAMAGITGSIIGAKTVDRATRREAQNDNDE